MKIVHEVKGKAVVQLLLYVTYIWSYLGEGWLIKTVWRSSEIIEHFCL